MNTSLHALLKVHREYTIISKSELYLFRFYLISFKFFLDVKTRAMLLCDRGWGSAFVRGKALPEKV